MIPRPNARPLLICLSHLRWNFVFQRPQHLLIRAAENFQVVFWEEPIISENPDAEPALNRAEPHQGVLVVTPVLPRDLGTVQCDAIQRTLLENLICEFAKPVDVAWFYTPMAVAFADALHARTTVYDCMDELSAFSNASPRLLLLERRLLRMADIVFTGGKSLQRAKEHLHANITCFPSAVERAHFVAARTFTYPEPADQASISHPRIGFFGVLDERLDCALIAEVAALRPDWQIVLIGPTAKIDPEDLPTAPNIHWLGAKTYGELPSYLAGWTAGLMPFAENEATQFISPTKTPEFLAAGVPLVSTPIHDVVADWGRDGMVAIARGAVDVVAALESVIARPRTAWLGRVDQALADISWDATWEQMRTLIDAAHRKAAAVEAHGSQHEIYDWLVVGAGFAGAVLAERLARIRGERVLVIDRRSHIAGNAFDAVNEAGLLVHTYGPHIFHTNSQAVVDYLSQFTAWRPYEHRVLAVVDGQHVPLPINLDTINRLYNLDLQSDELDAWFKARAVTIPHIRTSEDVVLSKVGQELYEKFFRGYTRKQWGLDPSLLDRAVTARVPVRTCRDDRYFSDSFQAMPADGYTAMFHKMLNHPNITVKTGTEYAEILNAASFQNLVWTGPVDEFFNFRHGHLPYRSLRFVHETHARETYQPVAVVNYPQTQDYTRITEYKHLTGQKHPSTSISYEFPSADGDPYYPIPTPENAKQYAHYRALADACPNTWFVGRLATYQYLNMDQVVGQALATFRRIDETAAADGGEPRLASAAKTARQDHS